MMMTTAKKCQFCGSKSLPEHKDYTSKKLDKITNEPIVVTGVANYKCTNEECLHTWLPLDEERRIDKEIYERSRYDLTSEEIKTIRECLPFSTKRKAAEFLCLNEKAFTKWEKDSCSISRANDLLLRLCAHSQSNFDFIKHLHQSSFKFVKEDYELICKSFELEWRYNRITHSTFEAKSEGPAQSHEYRNIAEAYYVSTYSTGKESAA